MDLTFFLRSLKGTLPWQPILASKLAKSANSPLFVALAFGNGLQYCTSDFKMFIYDDLATLYKYLVNFGPVTPEFKRVKDVHPSSITSFATFALLLDLAGSVLSFSEEITIPFCFTHTLEDVTAMPRWLHARRKKSKHKSKQRRVPD